jgi:uncharacterized protein (TIGR02466 family)
VSTDNANPYLEESRVLPLFPTFAWYVRLNRQTREPINQAIMARLEEMMAAKPTRQAGQLLQTDQRMHEDPAFAGLLPHIFSATQGALAFMKVRYQSFQITGCWANVAEAGLSHKEHCHPNNYLSGVYYVAAPEGGDAITFHDPRPQPNIFMPPTHELTNENAGKMNIGIKPGTLVLFPAWLNHSVPPNRSNDLRVSVAFNLMFNQFETDMSPPMWKGNL